MRLNHINLCATHLPLLAGKLVAHFGYHLIDSGDFPRQDGSGESQAFAAVVGQDGSELVISEINAIPGAASASTRGFHFGLIQDSREAVHAKHAELTAAGFQPGDISDGFEVWGSTWTAFYCPLGDGLEIEINYRTPSSLLDEAASEAHRAPSR